MQINPDARSKIIESEVGTSRFGHEDARAEIDASVRSQRLRAKALSGGGPAFSNANNSCTPLLKISDCQSVSPLQ